MGIEIDLLKNDVEIAFKDFYVLSNNLKISSDLIKFNKSKLKNLKQNLHLSINREIINNKEKYKNYIRLVETNSIHANLKKGYSILSKGKKVINESKLIEENDILKARLIDKTIEIKIKKVN